jgi:CHASE3 domain sensor protein
MRSRIPPLLPTYFLLVLVVVFAVGSLWVGVERLDAIERLAESRAESAATVQDLQALQSLVNDIVTSAQGFARTSDSANLELFERARRSVPAQLTSVRDRMRDTPAELSLIEQLVPLIGRTIGLAEGVIERARGAPDETRPTEANVPYRESLEAIRAIIANLESRERGQLADDGRALRAAIGTARILHYALATLIVLLAVLLFMAGRRLSSFIPPVPRADARSLVELGGDDSLAASHAQIGLLLRDTLARARLAATNVPTDDAAAGERIRASIAVLERVPLAADLECPRPGAANVVEGLAALARAYSQPAGLTVVPALDQSVAIHGQDKAFVIDRVAAWGLESIATRKRSGEVSLSFAANDHNASLRVLALLDHPNLSLRLSPREREEADFLRRAATAVGGQFVVNQGPTGFALVLTVPLDA